MDINWYSPKTIVPAIYGDYLILRHSDKPIESKYTYEVAFYDDRGNWYGENDKKYKNEDILAWCYLPDTPFFLED